MLRHKRIRVSSNTDGYVSEGSNETGEDSCACFESLSSGLQNISIRLITAHAWTCFSDMYKPERVASSEPDADYGILIVSRAI